MKWTRLMVGFFVPIGFVGLALAYTATLTASDGLTTVLDSEAAQITAGQPGSTFTWMGCGLAGKRGCSGQLGYNTWQAANPGAHGTDEFPCGGSCGVRWQGIKMYAQSS